MFIYKFHLYHIYIYIVTKDNRGLVSILKLFWLASDFQNTS